MNDNAKKNIAICSMIKRTKKETFKEFHEKNLN